MKNGSDVSKNVAKSPRFKELWIRGLLLSMQAGNFGQNFCQIVRWVGFKLRPFGLFQLFGIWCPQFFQKTKKMDWRTHTLNFFGFCSVFWKNWGQFELLSRFSDLTPSNSEIICGQNVSTKVVCGIFLFFEKKAMLKIWKKKSWVPFRSYLLNSTANPARILFLS